MPDTTQLVLVLAEKRDKQYGEMYAVFVGPPTGNDPIGYIFLDCIYRPRPELSFKPLFGGIRGKDRSYIFLRNDPNDVLRWINGEEVA